MIYLLALFFIISVLYLPIFFNPDILLQRGNDLEQFFWPIIYFVKQSILQNGQIPLWNNLFLSGTPLLPDPQNPIFYLPNIIFLFLPLNLGFMVSFLVHSFWGGLGIYLLAKNIFKFSPLTCLFLSSIYILNPHLVSHLEAGHFGLVLSLAWIPWVILSIFQLAQKPKITSVFLLSLSLAAIYFTHLLIFTICLFSTLVLYFLLFIQKKYSSKKMFFLFLGLILTFGLIAIAILPQLEWQTQTTRELLNKFPDTFPKWETRKEVLQALFWPWPKIFTLDSEKWISMGIFMPFLALRGFSLLKRRWKIIIILVFVFSGLIILNNLSPIFNFLISQDLYSQLRVSTRVWIILFIIIIFLAGLAFEKLSKWKVIIFIVVTTELLSMSWLQLLKPITKAELVPNEVYQFLEQDKELFRVFCVTRCIPQKQAAIYNLQLVEGYSTLIQKNYFEYFIQLDQVFWQTYTLSLPPMEIYKFRQIQPHAPTLAEYNIKYIIAPYKLLGHNLQLEKEINGFFIYKNSLVKPRAYFINTGNSDPNAKIIKYTPNHIRVDTLNHSSLELILAEVYSPGWIAYLNGKEETKIIEHINKLRKLNIKNDTLFVDFRYQSPSFPKGLFLSIITLILIFLLWKINHSR